MRYVFSQMSEASFSWRKELRSDAGLWQVVARGCVHTEKLSRLQKRRTVYF